MDEVKALLKSIGLKEIPETNVASIDGTHLDPLKGSVKPEGMNIKTLWGELAYQLGGQTMAFMQELTGAVAALAEDREHSSVLVITLPSSQAILNDTIRTQRKIIRH